MINVVRHCKLYSRSLIPNKVVGVRFLCDHCDCLFEASGDDLDVTVISTQERRGAFGDIFHVSANCPDCREKAIRYIWED